MPLAHKNGLILEYARAEDAEAIAPLFALSFHDHAYFRRMLLDTTGCRSAWAEVFRSACKDPHTICLKVTDEKRGKIVSHGRWVKPKKHVEDEQPGHEEERWSALDPHSDAETAEALFGAFARNRQEMMGERRHYYMELLMTAEECKGRGAGGMILEYGTALADEEQVECYIDASPAGRPLYERHGFLFTKQEKLSMDYHYNFGIREPKAEKEEEKIMAKERGVAN
ncbi:acyl-CoA N-acyltransferase, partial [Aureobasidium melanogenum]